MINTEYNTTNITPYQSYPTYQFHAFTASSAPAEQTFKICILETFRWLRNRLRSFSELPDVLVTPEPEDHLMFSEEKLVSFSLNMGCTINVVYLESGHVWTLTITENDMGANLGSENERKAVQGRVFTTEISFRKCSECVETGVRTICSEPVGTDVPCEVFRPFLVRKLSDDPLVLFRNQYELDGTSVVVESRSDAERLCSTILSSDFDMPVVIVCEPEMILKEKKDQSVRTTAEASSGSLLAVSSEVKSTASALSYSGVSLSGASLQNRGDSNSLDFVLKKDDSKKKQFKPDKTVPEKKRDKKPEKTETEKPEYIEQPAFDHSGLAADLKCYGVVFFVKDRVRTVLNNKLGTSLNAGDVSVLMHGTSYETVHYSDYINDVGRLRSRLKYEVREMLKNASFSYGQIIFGTDAMIKQIENRKKQGMTLEEKIEDLTIYNKALEEKVKFFEHNDNAKRMNAEELRVLNKKYESEIRAREKAENALETVEDELKNLRSSYEKTASVIDFYRQKSDEARLFPLHLEEVCDWAENRFSDTLVIAPRARNELRKYSGSLDVSDLCDGIYYLSGYAKFRRGEITEDELALYGESGNWETQFSGKSALRVCGEEYEVTYEEKKYIIDLHIKCGVKARQLIRIYFCWADDLKKILIGSMPEHLGTAKKNT